MSLAACGAVDDLRWNYDDFETFEFIAGACAPMATSWRDLGLDLGIEGYSTISVDEITVTPREAEYSTEGVLERTPYEVTGVTTFHGANPRRVAWTCDVDVVDRLLTAELVDATAFEGPDAAT